MSWEERALPAWHGNRRTTALVSFSTGDVCIVRVQCDSVEATGEASDLFTAFARARGTLDEGGIRVACNGCRIDVFASAMQRQWASGRRAYLLSLPRTDAKPPLVDIFEEAPMDAQLATVEEQEAWFEDWRISPLVKADDSE